ncbi:transcriptional repressor [Geomicrobium sp. JCM 19038]|nr:transcriptional repressor [Geomicrobium sp. JCM 19038]
MKKIADYFEVSTDYLLDHEIDKKDDLEFYKSKIATEFPYIDLMFKDLESFSAEDMKEVYEYIKFKKSQKDI